MENERILKSVMWERKRGIKGTRSTQRNSEKRVEIPAWDYKMEMLYILLLYFCSYFMYILCHKANLIDSKNGKELCHWWYCCKLDMEECAYVDYQQAGLQDKYEEVHEWQAFLYSHAALLLQVCVTVLHVRSSTHVVYMYGWHLHIHNDSLYSQQLLHSIASPQQLYDHL